jgi:endo-1,4-beta-D-glucanase Y
MTRIAMLLVLVCGCNTTLGAPGDGEPNLSGGAGGNGSGGSAGNGSGGSGGGTGGSGGGTGGSGGGMGCTTSGDAAQPFGNHNFQYASGSILPSNRSQQQLDDAVRSYYDGWKQHYLRQGCGQGRYYIATGQTDSQTVSEGQGYGMVITAYMAGADPDAHAIFDGLYQYFADHPSANTADLMAWSQDRNCANNQGPDSASDGDLDIAYSLYLADKQWGSGGGIDYRAAGDRVSSAILRAESNATAGFVRLGDWATQGDQHYDATRPSDFMPDHYATFLAGGGGTGWAQMITGSYQIMQRVQSSAAAQTGLLPDFVVRASTSTPAPAAANFLEGANDGNYSYNACRVPLRVGADFVTSGEQRAADLLAPLNAWLQQSTGGNPHNIRPGYTLAGRALATDYESMAFTAPIGVAAMTDAANQSWLDAIWDAVESAPVDGYYEDSLKLLSMIVMSGNWWKPENAPCPQ